jgi:hypothetical protein
MLNRQYDLVLLFTPLPEVLAKEVKDYLYEKKSYRVYCVFLSYPQNTYRLYPQLHQSKKQAIKRVKHYSKNYFNKIAAVIRIPDSVQSFERKGEDNLSDEILLKEIWIELGNPIYCLRRKFFI